MTRVPFELFLAWRFLFSRNRRLAGRMTALSAVIGISFGVAALIVALSLSNGFRDEMRDKILQGTAHISVMRTDGLGIEDYSGMTKKLSTIKGVTAAYGTSFDGALVVGPRATTYAIVRGLDAESVSAKENLKRLIISGSVGSVESESSRAGATLRDATLLPDAVIGVELATRTGLFAGDTAEIITADDISSAALLAPSSNRVRIAGIFRSGLYEYDSTWIYLPLETKGAVSGVTKAATVIGVEIDDVYRVQEIAERIKVELGEAFTTVDWQEANRPLFAALALERRMGLFIIALIILVAALNITTTLILLVIERRGDIAALSAAGASSHSVMLIFALKGALIGSIGALAGVLLGLIACWIGDRFNLVSLPADVYSINNVPFHTRLSDVALAASFALFLSLIATIYPARLAANSLPAEVLRDA